MKEYYVHVQFSDGTTAETSKGKEIEACSEGEALDIFISKVLDNPPTFMKDNAYIVKTKVERKATQGEEINSRVNELTRQIHEIDNIVADLESNVFWSTIVAWVALGLVFSNFIF